MRPYACVERGRLCEPKTTNYHLQGPSLAYDGVHAQNREALTDRITIIVRVRKQASRRDAEPAGRPTAGGASLAFFGITRRCAVLPGGDGGPAGVRRGYFCRKLRGA